MIGLGVISGKKGHKHAGLVSWKEPKRKKWKGIDCFGINYGRNIEKTGSENTVNRY